MKNKELIIFSKNDGTKPFIEWLESLDGTIKGRIEARLLRISLGNYGDYKYLQQGIYEFRFVFGSGYRVYFGEDKGNIVVLLVGGNKGSQKKDIKKAVEYWHLYKGNNNDKTSKI